MSNLRAATAVFRFDRNHWETDGRAIFNLSPAELEQVLEKDKPIDQALKDAQQQIERRIRK